jgi:hypothetical protein
VEVLGESAGVKGTGIPFKCGMRGVWRDDEEEDDDDDDGG